MIEVLPMENREEEARLLSGLNTENGEPRILLMKDGGKPVGYAGVKLSERVLYILKLSVYGYDETQPPQGEDAFVLDTLLRSAASYGENFGADQIVTAFPDFHGFFKARGFETDETHAFTPMSTIVRYDG